ncbi:dipeptidase [Nocardia brasiliensis]|uniref:dipeptidase n=1 Tax=Nocardia brasiliensis TaxID=37326 RepID=UPI001E4593D8|nr:membrane dipeptidase [Nocardia brasiliensis]
MSQHPWAPTPELRERARHLVDRNLTIDIHTHPRAIMPPLVRRAAERIAALPRDPLANLTAAGVDLVVLTAVGDALGTAWRFGGPWRAVGTQLDAAIHEAEAAGLAVTTDPAQASAGSSSQVVLGVEGADFLGEDLERLELLHQRGLRVLGLMHYADNRIGSIGSTLTGRVRRSAGRATGLTGYGRELLGELNRLAIVPDLAHADRDTTLAVCEESDFPVISSHTAASAVRDFPRYISDVEIDAIAWTGGVIGLWPASMRGRAMTDLDDFARHAMHIAELVGVEHLAIGTDKNGVPDYADGYCASTDFANLAAALLRIGFADDDVAAILGGNAHRVLTHAEQRPRTTSP